MTKRLLQTGYKTFFLTLIFIAGFLCFPGFLISGWGQTQTFLSSGTFIAPPGVTSITIECWGGGGGGSTISSSGKSGGGGGGGAYARSTVTVTSGSSYTVVVGTGGAANSTGGNSTFNSTSVVAAGGTGAASNSATAGVGGTTASSTGTLKYAGGNGADGGNTYSGGGGGGAGSTGAGGAASGAIAGTGHSLNGGDGGAGVSGRNNGLPGNAYGGGGSGAVTNNKNDRSGGSGAAGLVVITVPELTVMPASLDFGYVVSGGTSLGKTYTLSGTNLIGSPGNITVTAPANFEVSLSSGSAFGSSVSVPYSSSTLASTTIYVRFKPTAINTGYSGVISNSGGSLSTGVDVSGTTLLTYCTPISNYGTGDGDYITLVQLGTINNSTGALSTPFYNYYDGLSTDLINNSYYSITLSAGSYASDNNISVWIDFNQNGTFESTEKLGNITLGATPAIGTINFSVPAGALSGITRMRVREGWNNTNMDPCLQENYGETEDYKVNIVPTITTGTISGSPFCAGSSVSVPFTISGTFTSGNLFAAQLSNSSGSFAAPVNIGTLTSVIAGTITGLIPAGTAFGSGYRVRVVSNTPVLTGTDNGTNLTVNPISSAPSAPGSLICIGTGTTLTASGAVAGDKYIWYNAATGGTVLKTSTNNTDNTFTTPTLASTTNYWVSIVVPSGCESPRTPVTATLPDVSADNQNAAGSNTWVGHVYDGTNQPVANSGIFSNYYGSYTEPELFDQSFGGSTNCFSISSGSSNPSARSIYTETFSVRYRMNSNKKGLYVADLGSDDGTRLTVDGALLYNNWSDQGFVSRPRVLMNLTGASSLVYDFYENGGGNQAVFQNLNLVFANTLNVNLAQNICLGSSGLAISGNVFGTLPSGITVPGTGYQWAYSKISASGPWTDISGATSATYSPSSAVAPLNSAGTYYLIRKAILSSVNNVSPNPYLATNESNAAIITVNAILPVSVTIAASANPVCAGTGVTFTATPVNGGTTPSYQWKLNGSNVGTNSPTYVNASLANGNNVSCVLTSNATCTSGNPATSNTITMSITDTPTAYSVTGGGSYCSGLIGVAVGLDNSESGVNYQLYRGTSAVGSAVGGTGFPISFENQTVSGTYTVLAIPASGSCSANMSGSAVISSGPGFPDFTGTVTDATCPDATDGAVEILNVVDPAVVFSNVNNTYVDLGGNLLSNLGQFTIEGWVKFNKSDIGSRMSLFGQNDVIEFGFSSSTVINCWTASGGSTSVDLTAYPSDNGWHHIAAVGNGVSITLYIDGSSVASGGNTTSNYGNNTSYTSKIGGGVWDATGGSFTGQIAKVGFWSTALNTIQLAALASGSDAYAGSESELIAGYNFAEGSGISLSSLPSGNTGTLINFQDWVYSTIYDWTKTGDNSFSQTTKNITGLSPGEYTLAVTNEGCTKYKIYTVNSIYLATIISSQSTSAQTACVGGSFAPISVTATGSGTLTYHWYRNVNAATTGGTSLETENGAQTSTYTPQTSSAGTMFYYCIVTGTCGSFTSAVSGAFIAEPIRWTGAVNTDWNTPGNWSCNVVPDLSSDVIIPNVTNQPVLSSGDAGTVKDLTINTGSSLTVDGNTLQIAGTISNSGTITASSGTIEMKGSAPQVIGADVFSGNTIQNLYIENPSGVNLQGSLMVTGIVAANSGNISSNGNLTLISTDVQTALIDGAGSGEVLGNVTMQRYLSNAYGYKYFSSPFQSATVNEFTDELDLNASFPTFYSYDENHLSLAGNDMAGWTTYTATDGSLNQLEGYAANFGSVSAAQTTALTGIVTNGPLQTSLMNHNGIYTKGFNLVGNPYPSPIDWNAPEGWTKSNIDDAIYFFNPGITDQYTGVYSSYVNGVETGNGTNLIASMQGFFVHVTNGSYPVSGILGVTNAVRTNNFNPLFKSARIDNRAILAFSANFENNQVIEDEAKIYFDDQGSLSFDRKLDALKLNNTDVLVPNIYTLTPDNKQLSVNCMATPVENTTSIPLGFSTLSDDWMNFDATDITQLPALLNLYLVDTEKGITQDLKLNPQYRFYLKAGEYNQRFSLVFSYTEIDNSSTVAEKLFTFSHSANLLFVKVNLPLNTRGSLMVTTILGQVILRKEVSEKETVEINPDVSSSIFVVTVISGNRKESEKILMRKNYE
ncbi:MAG TPA: GEVED domain-containing protein [Prolixibacteraceae bacterium]|nr:GEVED domain-containing protein [Prolixibacteraceae bacterium]